MSKRSDETREWFWSRMDTARRLMLLVVGLAILGLVILILKAVIFNAVA